MKKKKYEITLLFHSHINEETIQETIKSLFKSLKDDEYKVLKINNVGRYDALYKNGFIKINLFYCQFEIPTQNIGIVKKNASENESIYKFLIIKDMHIIIPKKIDYKYPIEMKKYMYESLKIMPNQLTGFAGKVQKILAKNIKRAKILRLIGKINN